MVYKSKAIDPVDNTVPSEIILYLFSSLVIQDDEDRALLLFDRSGRLKSKHRIRGK